MVPEGVQNVTVYDPAAGSGTLVLALAHEIGESNCTIYTQDISQKSNEFLRLNLILNNLVHSLGHVVHGDTLLSPQHLNRQKNGLMKFDYIVSNPPFNVDFLITEILLREIFIKKDFGLECLMYQIRTRIAWQSIRCSYSTLFFHEREWWQSSRSSSNRISNSRN